MRTKRLLTLAAILLSAALTVTARAQTTNSWIAAFGSLWDGASRWSDGQPSLSDSANLITNASSKTINILNSTVTNSLVISNLTVQGVGSASNILQLTNVGTNTPLTVINAATISSGGALVITNSSVLLGTPGIQTVSNKHFVVNGSNIVGIVRLDNGVLLATNVQTTIGDTGPASLTINNGTFKGRNVVVGQHAGTGTITLNGGRFELTGNANGGATLIIGGPSGGGPNAQGAVWVNGGEMVLTNNFTTFVGGNTGSGRMTVSNGNVRAFDLFVGANTVAGAGTFTQAGGTTEVTVVRLSIGYNPGSTGFVWVTGGTLLATNEFVDTLVGGGGNGWLIISNGDVQVSHLIVATNAAGSGTLSVFGGTLTILSSNSLKLATASSAIANVSVLNATLNAAKASVVIGDKGTGAITLSNSIGSMRTVSVAAGTDSTGTLTIRGGSTLSIADTLGVGMGSNSTSSLLITEGSQLTVSIMNAGNAGNAGNATNCGSAGNAGNACAAGKITVSDAIVQAGSVAVASGSNSVGTLIINSNSFVRITDSLTVGPKSNSFGTLLVTDGGMLLVTNSGSAMRLGPAGAEVLVDNGTVVAGTLRVGALNPPGKKGLTVANSGNLNVLGNVELAGDPDDGGEIFVSNGGYVSVLGDLGVAGDPDDGGEVFVSNASVSARRVLLGKGARSLGSLVVTSAATTVVSELMEIGTCSGTGTGRVTLAGGSLFVTNASHNAELNLSRGELAINSGALVVDKLVITNSCGQFVHNGGTVTYLTLILTPSDDTDGDGLPNGWEQSFGLDPLDASGDEGAGGDPDNDGFTNLQEFLAGTSPTIEMKAITRESNNIRVTWQFPASKTNVLQRSPGSNGSYSNNFADLFMVTNAVGGVTNYLDIGAITNFPSLFYRVRLVP